MKEQALKQLTRRYELERSLLRLERQLEAFPEAISEAKFQNREAQEAELTYDQSLRGFLDRLRGVREEKTEALRREVRRTEQALRQLLRERENAAREHQLVTEALEQQPSAESLRQAAGEKSWAKLEAGYCAEALIPLLAENYRTLLEYRELMQGQHPEILSPDTQQQIAAAPNIWAEQCRPLVTRLAEAMAALELPFESGSYFEAPAPYLVNVAARHNRMDRINRAMEQVLALKKTAARLLEQE